MGTDDGRDISGGPLNMPPQEMLSIDVDIDLKVARIMAETWKDIDAIREGSGTSNENSGSASGPRNPRSVPGPAEPATVELAPEPEAPAAGYVAELERLANSLHDIGDTPVPAPDPVEVMLSDIRTEHASLAEAITRLRTAVAEVDACSEAFRRAMERYEATGGEQMLLREPATPPPSDPSHIDPGVTEEATIDASSAKDKIDRRAALNALRSLTT